MIDVDALIRLQEASFARAKDGLRSSWPRESGMDAAQLRSFLDGHRYCVLATTAAQLHPVARPVAVDGPAAITREPSEQLLAAWETRHGSRAEWAAAWFQIQPARLISYSANNKP